MNVLLVYGWIWHHYWIGVADVRESLSFLYKAMTKNKYIVTQTPHAVLLRMCKSRSH